ncbi:hypothetical protein [Halorussus caseinilyticus]|uniref:Organic solvent tolerance-like N-terminal domain-containing protein n=1 Tax=Halorussus caseinilyticus TaxID=3034025 RepID=A0ABD5WQA8_9EURY
MSGDEKLSRPSFEKYEAGRDVTNDRLDYGGATDDSVSATQTLTFECSYVDRSRDAYRVEQGLGTMTIDTAAQPADASAVAKSDARTTGRAKFADENAQQVTVEDAKYVVADDDMTRNEQVEGVPDGGTTYVEAEQAMRAYVESNPGRPGRSGWSASTNSTRRVGEGRRERRRRPLRVPAVGSGGVPTARRRDAGGPDSGPRRAVGVAHPPRRGQGRLARGDRLARR